MNDGAGATEAGFTCEYASPQLLLHNLEPKLQPDLMANDMWAMGALLAFMLNAQELFGTALPNELTPEQIRQQRPRAVIRAQLTWVRAFLHDLAVALCILEVLADNYCSCWVVQIYGNSYMHLPDDPPHPPWLPL